MVSVNRVKLFRIQTWLDERTFEAIFTAHYTRVYEILFRLTGDAAAADDLAAETFWRLWEKPPAQPDNIGGWLYRVAVRSGYNNLRASRRRAAYESQAGHEPQERQQHGDPAQQAEQRIERAKVREVLRQMAERDAQILVLRHSGLSYNEIAAVLEIKPTSVGTLLARAEDRFEALYGKGDDHASKK